MPGIAAPPPFSSHPHGLGARTHTHIHTHTHTHARTHALTHALTHTHTHTHTHANTHARAWRLHSHMQHTLRSAACCGSSVGTALGDIGIGATLIPLSVAVAALPLPGGLVTLRVRGAAATQDLQTKVPADSLLALAATVARRTLPTHCCCCCSPPTPVRTAKPACSSPCCGPFTELDTK